MVISNQREVHLERPTVQESFETYIKKYNWSVFIYSLLAYILEEFREELTYAFILSSLIFLLCVYRHYNQTHEVVTLLPQKVI